MSLAMTFRTLAIALAAALCVGCQADTEPIAGSPDDTDLYPRVTLTSRSLQEAIGVGAPVESQTAVGNLRVLLPVRARTSDQAHVEYRIIWFDRAGQIVRPGMTWTPKRFEPKQPDQLTFAASSAEAVDYNIQIRWGRR